MLVLISSFALVMFTASTFQWGFMICKKRQHGIVYVYEKVIFNAPLVNICWKCA